MASNPGASADDASDEGKASDADGLPPSNQAGPPENEAAFMLPADCHGVDKEQLLDNVRPIANHSIAPPYFQNTMYYMI